MYNGEKGVDPDEVLVAIPNGFLVFESYAKNPNGTSYVRFVDQNLVELLYYSVDEWTESESQGENVMGAIMGAIQHGAKRIRRTACTEYSVTTCTEQNQKRKSQ